MNETSIDPETQLPVVLKNRLDAAERDKARAREALAKAEGELTALAPQVRDWFNSNPELVAKRTV